MIPARLRTQISSHSDADHANKGNTGSAHHDGHDEAALRFSARYILLSFPIGTTVYFTLASDKPPGSEEFLWSCYAVGLCIAGSSSIIDLIQRAQIEIQDRKIVRLLVLLLIWIGEWGFSQFL